MRRWWASSLHAVGNRNLPWPYESTSRGDERVQHQCVNRRSGGDSTTGVGWATGEGGAATPYYTVLHSTFRTILQVQYREKTGPWSAVRFEG